MTGNDVPTGSVGNHIFTPLTSTFFSTLEKNFLPFRSISFGHALFSRRKRITKTIFLSENY